MSKAGVLKLTKDFISCSFRRLMNTENTLLQTREEEEGGAFERTLVASEFIDWLLQEGEIATREEAEQLGRRLLEHGIIQHGKKEGRLFPVYATCTHTFVSFTYFIKIIILNTLNTLTFCSVGFNPRQQFEWRPCFWQIDDLWMTWWQWKPVAPVNSHSLTATRSSQWPLLLHHDYLARLLRTKWEDPTPSQHLPNPVILPFITPCHLWFLSAGLDTPFLTSFFFFFKVHAEVQSTIWVFLQVSGEPEKSPLKNTSPIMKPK